MPSLSTASTTTLEIPLQGVPTLFHLIVIVRIMTIMTMTIMMVTMMTMNMNMMTIMMMIIMMTTTYLRISPVSSHVVINLRMLERENSLDVELVAEVDGGEDGGELQEEDDPHQAGVHRQEDPVLGGSRHEAKDGEEEEHDADGNDEVGHGGKVL